MDYFAEKEREHWAKYEADADYRETHELRQTKAIEAQKAIDDQVSMARNLLGRYTLQEAAQFISDNSAALYDDILPSLAKGANTGSLPFYKPGSNARYNKRTAILNFYEEVFWDDLNKWLEINEPRLGCLFPMPATMNATKPIQARENVSNDTQFSGLLNVPLKIDDWFQVIDDMARDFFSQYGKIPNETQAWSKLCERSPDGYMITTVKDRGEDCLNMPGVKPLSKSAFSKRWGKYRQ